MRRLIVLPDISRRIGAILSRNGMVRLLSDFHGELPAWYNSYRQLRQPDDDRLFRFFVAVADGDQMHSFTFLVDDSTSPEHLVVEDFEHSSRPREG